jgi:tetraacyldisaccharide 4'-kinase
MTRPRPRRARWLQTLKPLSAVYGWLIARRNRRYDEQRGVISAGVPVISVGNITVGGTGKTPFVLELIDQLLKRGRRPAILTRGYGAKPGTTADEVQEFQAQHPDLPVIVDPNRVRGAGRAVQEFQADVLVMDDGFQHRRLGRDLDLVLIDAWNPWGGEALLPAGRLREPLSSLQRAGLICITRANQVSEQQCEAILQRLAEVNASAPIITSHVLPSVVIDQDERAITNDSLTKLRLQPVCGLGNPLTFTQLCQELSPVVRTPLTYPDHHNYTHQDAQIILQAAAERGVDLLVTTRKDWGKLVAVWPAEAAIRLARIEMTMQVQDEAGVLDAALDRVLEDHR